MKGIPCARLIVLTLGLLAAGCGGGPKLVPVEGVVQINGKALGNIAIQFQPDALKGVQGPTSFASTDAEGKFRLRTFDGREGAVVGTHVVLLTDELEDRPAQGSRGVPKPPRIAPKYSLPTSALRLEVKEGGAPLVIEVSAR
jgi:hypothetical protein